MSAASARLEQQLNGGASMPTVDVKRKPYAVKTDLTEVLAEMSGSDDGLLFGNAAYKALCKKMRDAGMENNPTDIDPSTGYYNVSEWSLAGATAKVQVSYRVPMYTNSNGYLVKGKRLRLIDAQ